MAKLSMIILAMALCMIMLVIPEAQSISCDTVVETLEPCLSYLKEGGDVPEGCCNAIKSLKSAASTTAERQEVCNCLKSAAESSGVNSNYASGLPKACGVNLGYSISYSTNCNSVK